MSIDEKIEKVIAEVAPYFEMIPGSVIIHHLPTQTVKWMSEWGLRQLGVSRKEMDEMGQDYFPRFFNAEEAKEYVPKVFDFLEKARDNDILTIFQQVRIVNHDDWVMFLTSIKVFLRDDNGYPVYTLLVSIPVEPNHNFYSKVDRLLEENSFLRKNKEKFAALSVREREVLALAAMGNNNKEIAEQLYLSEETVKTHRRNIRRKLKPNNRYDLLKFAQAFDMI